LLKFNNKFNHMTEFKNKLIKIILFTFLANIQLIAQTGLSIHGYLNQAFAVSDGNQIFGIPKDGTSDYRNLALQFRYDIDEKSNFVIQFSHKRAGLTPLMALEQDVKLDWAHFEYFITENFSTKIGKIQLPFGFYNEFRDVGVLIPFYSLSFSPYGESNYMSETLDGISFHYKWDIFESWVLNCSIYGGHWNLLEWQPALNSFLQPSVANIAIENGVGGQVQVETPVDGWQIGTGGQFITPDGGMMFGENALLGKDISVLLYYLFSRYDHHSFFLHSELLTADLSKVTLKLIMTNSQIGIHILNNLDINFQFDYTKLNNFEIPVQFSAIAGTSSRDIVFNTDYAIGLKYKLTSNFVIKSEIHWNEGFLVEDQIFNFLLSDPLKTKYAIFSIATSF